jgi:signal transduction histidine kinase
VALRSRVHWPRRTVRLRLTALYGGLFLASGAGLLAITYALVAGQPMRAFFQVAGTVRGSVTLLPAKARVLVPPPAPGGVFITRSASGGPTPPQLPSAVRALLRNALPGNVNFLAFQATLPTPGELHRLLIESGIALALMAVVSIGLGWLVAGRVLRPLRAMTVTARQISEESLDERLAVHGPADELKDLGDTIDGLLARLETAFEAQRRFVANASHELRTPLAMMRTSLDVALGKPSPVPAEVTVLAGKLGEGLDQADKLLEGLLLLARAQQGGVGEITEVSLRSLVAEALDADRAEIVRRALVVDDGTVEGDVTGNETLLARLVANVVDNAVRHNVPGGRVHISSGSRGARARLVVESDGAVIPQEEAQHLGEPFYRLGAERVANNDGTGLGLSIVRAIANGHSGSLQLQARPEGGLRVVVELPAAPVRV